MTMMMMMLLMNRLNVKEEEESKEYNETMSDIRMNHDVHAWKLCVFRCV